MRLNLRWTACASVLISSVFARPGHAAQQHVAAGEERGEDFLDDRLLADDRAPELVAQTRREALRLVEREHRAKLYQRTDELLRQTGCVQAMRPFDSSTFARTYSSSPRNTYSAGLDSASLRI